MDATTSTPESAPIYFNPWDESFRANPYPHYKPLLAGPPRLLNLGMELALVARYADVKAVLLDPANFSSGAPDMGGAFKEQNDLFGRDASMLMSDPPVHSRLRKLVSRDFTPRRIRELEPRIREITNQLVDAAAGRRQFDVIADLANVLPVMVIAEMLGVPRDHYQTFKRWSDKIIEGDNVLPGMPMPDDIKTAITELRAFFREQIKRRRVEPGPDLISALVAAHEDEALSEGELEQFVILLLLAGNETTTNLIGNGSLALARHPDQMAMLRAKPDLMPRAIDEMLRYDGPVQSTFRTTVRDTNVGGTDIKAGTGTFVILAAANRDPAHFPNPETFDITRDPNDHLAFGEGIHFCLGSGLARLEGSIAIGTMLERFPNLQLKNPDAPLTYKGSYFLRGLARLEMTVE